MSNWKKWKKDPKWLPKWLKKSNLWDNIWHRYPCTVADYPGAGKISSEQVAEFTLKHMHWWDKLNPRMVAAWSIVSQDVLFGVIKPKKKYGDNWKYPFHDWE